MYDRRPHNLYSICVHSFKALAKDAHIDLVKAIAWLSDKSRTTKLHIEIENSPNTGKMLDRLNGHLSVSYRAQIAQTSSVMPSDGAEMG